MTEKWVKTGLKECPNCGLVCLATATHCPECFSPDLNSVVIKMWVPTEPSIEMAEAI